LSEGERVAIQRQFNKQFHRGHVAGAKTGGSIARENMWPEHGMRNSLHGALPRWPVQVMEQLGVPKDWIGAYYEKVLASEGMPAAPRISDELAMAADERMVTPVSGMPSNIKGQTRWASDIPTDVRKKKWQPDLTGEAGIDPATLEMRAWKQQDAMAQVGEEAVRAQQANLSATMSHGNAVAQSGPSRVVQKGVPFGTKRGVPKGLLGGYPVEYGMRLPIPVPSMKDLKQNALGIGLGAATEAITPESAYAAGKGDWRTAAMEAARSIGTGAVVGGAVQAGLTNLMPRAAAALASGPALPYVAAVSTGLALKDAAQAYRAGQAGRSIPLQQKIEQTEQGKRRQQDVAQFRAAMPGVASKNRMQANLSGNLSPQQIESFRAGGGNAAMMRDNLSVQQIIERGSALRLRKVLESTIRKEGDV